MKRTLFLLCAGACVLFSCNDNASSDSVDQADSANEAKQDTSNSSAATTPIQTDEATTDFLVKAADGGMAEVNAGKMGQDMGTNERVKHFAMMMVQDHTAANGEVKSLSTARNVTLPDATSNENQQKATRMQEKKGKDFDKAFMDMMVDDHKKTIDLFEKAEKDSKDAEVKTFISNTLPKLRMHLDSAQAIKKALK